MGPEIAALGAAEIIPAALAIGGSLMQKSAMDDAEARQRAATQRALTRDAQYANRAQQLVQDTAEQYRPQQREPAEQQAEQQAFQSLAGRLTEGVQAQPSAQVAGAVSNDYLTDKARRSIEETDRSANLARLMAKVRAPNDLRFGEKIASATNAADVGSLAADRGAMFNAGGLDTKQAGQPDGGAMLLGGLGQSVGTTMLGKKLMSAKPAASAADAAMAHWDF